jgi:hypothetical protein
MSKANYVVMAFSNFFQLKKSIKIDVRLMWGFQRTLYPADFIFYNFFHKDFLKSE